MISRKQAVYLKLHFLSEGLQFSDEFLKQFAEDDIFMEKRKVYNNPDESYDRYIYIEFLKNY